MGVLADNNLSRHHCIRRDMATVDRSQGCFVEEERGGHQSEEKVISKSRGSKGQGPIFSAAVPQTCSHAAITGRPRGWPVLQAPPLNRTPQAPWHLDPTLCACQVLLDLQIRFGITATFLVMLIRLLLLCPFY